MPLSPENAAALATSAYWYFDKNVPEARLNITGHLLADTQPSHQPRRLQRDPDGWRRISAKPVSACIVITELLDARVRVDDNYHSRPSQRTHPDFYYHGSGEITFAEDTEIYRKYEALYEAMGSVAVFSAGNVFSVGTQRGRIPQLEVSIQLDS